MVQNAEIGRESSLKARQASARLHAENVYAAIMDDIARGFYDDFAPDEVTLALITFRLNRLGKKSPLGAELRPTSVARALVLVDRTWHGLKCDILQKRIADVKKIHGQEYLTTDTAVLRQRNQTELMTKYFNAQELSLEDMHWLDEGGNEVNLKAFLSYRVRRFNSVPRIGRPVGRSGCHSAAKLSATTHGRYFVGKSAVSRH